MPKESLSPKTPELSQQELEQLLKVKLVPGLSLEHLFFGLNLPEACRFIVTKDFDIFLDFDMHYVIKNKTAKQDSDCLLPGGFFSINYLSGQPDFVHHDNSLYLSKKEAPIRRAVENKIKAFLIENRFKAE